MKFDERRLTLQTSPSNLVFGSPIRADNMRNRKTFDHIIGIGKSYDLLGRTGHTQRELIVPEDWADSLKIFFKHMVKQAPAPRSHNVVGTNCHGFTSLMTHGRVHEHPPEQDRHEQRPIEENTPFGTLITLEGIDFGTMHSAIYLGEQAPGECIQVTVDQGVLAIDSLDNITNSYISLFGDSRIAGWVVPTVHRPQMLM